VNLLEEGGNDTVQVQPWIPYSKHSVMCLRFVVDMVQYMVQPCGTIQVRSNSDFDVIFSTVQFYAS